MVQNGILTLKYQNEEDRECVRNIVMDKFFPITKAKGKIFWPIFKEYAPEKDMLVVCEVLERKLAEAQIKGKPSLISRTQSNLWVVEDALGRSDV